MFCIADNAVFDPLYSMLRSFPLLHASLKVRAMDLLTSAVGTCIKEIHAPSPEGVGGATTSERRNVFKMLCFLLCTGVTVAEKFAVHSAKVAKDEAANSGKGKGKGKAKGKSKSRAKSKKAVAAAALEGGEFVWEPLLQQALTVLLQALETDFTSLWSCGVPEEAFLGVFTKMALRVCEFPGHMSKLNAGSRDKLLRLIATCGHKCPSIVTTITTALVRMINGFEHMSSPCADLARILAIDMEDTRIVGDIIRELGHMETGDTKDSAGLRNVASFLIGVSEQVPQVVLHNVSVLLPHLDGESYMIRSAVVQSLGFISARAFAKDGNKDDGKTGNAEKADEEPADTEEHRAQQARARDALLDVLQERIFDVHAYVRSAVVKAWIQLVEDGALPLTRIHPVMVLTVDRLHDKAAVVRKMSLQLLTTMLERNPFGADLRPNAFEEELERLNGWLKENAPKDGDDVPEGGEAETKEESKDDDASSEPSEAATADEGSSEGAESGDADDSDEGEDAELQEELLRNMRAREYCIAVIGLSRQMQEAVPIVAQLLGSKNGTDATEAMRFLACARAFRVPGSEDGLKKMLTLIWSDTQSVKDEVLTTFQELYMFVPGTNGKKRQPAMAIAHNLVSLVSGSALAVRTSLEEVIAVLVRERKLSKAVIKCLWTMATAGESDEVPEAVQFPQQRYALAVLSMAAATEPRLVSSPESLTMLSDAAFSGAAKARSDYRLAKHACVALQKVSGMLEGEATADAAAEERDALLTAITARIASFIRGDWDEGIIPNDHWFAAAEQGITAIFTLHNRPERICEGIVQHMASIAREATRKATGIHTTAVARLFFALGHIAVKLLVHTEALAVKVKKTRMAAADAVEKQMVASKAASGGDDGSASAPDKEAIEEELGLNGADEEAESTFLTELSERHIVCRHLLGAFGPFISRVVTTECAAGVQKAAESGSSGDSGEATAASGAEEVMEAEEQKEDAGPSTSASHHALRQSALLALCKFMSVSSKFCEANLQLLFTVLQNTSEPSLRATIAIALGDLAVRFPNLLEPWVHHLYLRLRDTDTGVRKNTLMVLTHLILNDMVKVRGQAAEIAVCLEDEDPRIRDLTHLFFHELSKRGSNPIYNVLPDTLGQLSRHPAVDAKAFQSVMKFLIGFIGKDKQTESLVDKFCQRFESTEDVQQWRDLAFCLEQLKMNDTCIRKMIDNVRLYKGALIDEAVLASFQAIVIKARKTAKAEMKDAVTEWERAMEAFANGDEDAVGLLTACGAAKSSDGGLAGLPRSTAAARALAKRRKAEAKLRGDAEDKPKPRKRKPRKKVVESSSDEDDYAESDSDESLAELSVSESEGEAGSGDDENDAPEAQPASKVSKGKGAARAAPRARAARRRR